MKAAVMRAVGQPLVMEDVAVPRIGPGEALVETRTSGICGTDLHILAGHGYVPALAAHPGPRTRGRGGRGGRRGHQRPPGRPRRAAPVLQLRALLLLPRRAGSSSARTCAGILGVLCPGAFAEYFKVPAENLFLLPDSGAVRRGRTDCRRRGDLGLHAVKRRAALQLGDTAVVMGAGGIGQILMQILTAVRHPRRSPPHRTPEKLRLASGMGAAMAFAPPSRETRDGESGNSPGGGARCVFDCVGTARSMQTAAKLRHALRPHRGHRRRARQFPLIDTTEIAQRELEIIGSRNGTRQDMVEAIRLVESGIVKPYVAARFPLEPDQRGLRLRTRQGALGRVVVVVKE